MKKNYILIIALFAGLYAKSQDTIRFESFNLAVDSFWNGGDFSGGFTESGIEFVNLYDTTYGAAYATWEGFAYSNKKDSTTAGYTNQYSCISSIGANNSETYTVGFLGYSTVPTIKFNGNASSVDGFWINNSTYTYLSMKNGDSAGKTFGDSLNAAGANDGTNGNDWFKLTTYIYSSIGIDSVDFYLADFRFTDSADDYIVKDWNYITLPTNSNPDSLTFKVKSTDNHPMYGMNTPAYFCLDNIQYTKNVTSVNGIMSKIDFNTYPNPTTDYVTVNLSELNGNMYSVALFDANGREIKQVGSLSAKQITLDMTNLNKGNYFVKVIEGNNVSTKKIVKF